MSESKDPTVVPLQTAIDALGDVLVDYNVPTDRVLAEFRRLLAVYVEADR